MMAVIQKRKEEYAVYFSRPKGLKIYDDDYALDEVVEPDDRPWHPNWDEEEMVKPKFSVSHKGNYKLYHCSDHGILQGYDGVRTEVDLNYVFRNTGGSMKLKDENTELETEYHHSVEKQEYLFISLEIKL